MRTRHTMKSNYDNRPNGYLETIQQGLSAVRSFRSIVSAGAGAAEESVSRIQDEIESADAIIIGAGAGLSTAAGLTYSGERFEKYFGDFAARFGISDIYSGGFYPFPDDETRWAWWARHIYFNRYIDPPKPVYKDLLELVQDKNYFIITTNVDHQFRRAGFEKERLFYTQGDYGLFQTLDGRNGKTYDNKAWVMQAMEEQGFVKDTTGVFQVPEEGDLKTFIPTELIPKCPDDGGEMTMNLRSDDTFVEDEGWHRASAAYSDFLRANKNQHVLFLEIGVGANTPVIIKYPFWAMTKANPKAVYTCLNYDEAFCPKEIERQAICVNGDAGELLLLIKNGF